MDADSSRERLKSFTFGEASETRLHTASNEAFSRDINGVRAINVSPPSASTPLALGLTSTFAMFLEFGSDQTDQVKGAPL